MEPVEQQNAFINEALQQWGTEVVRRLSQQIQAKGLVLTEDTLKSLRMEVLKATAESTGKLLLSFNESGRIRDMRRINYKNMPPVEVMEQFVKEIGLDKFKYVPSYRKLGKVPTESQAINRIAWGIAKGKLANNKTKPKRWFNKPFYGMVDSLIEVLINKYADFTQQQITEPFFKSE